MDLKQYHKITK